MENGGVLTTAKHFPGHGDTSTDSHKTLPVVDHSIDFMNDNDLVPFTRYINARLSGIMVGHLSIPSLDPSGTPASLSRQITTELLQNQLGFDGLIFTDALEMKGAVAGDANNCVSAIKAGVDMLLSSTNPPVDIKAVLDAVQSGEISQDEIDRRCRKVLAYKWVPGYQASRQNKCQRNEEPSQHPASRKPDRTAYSRFDYYYGQPKWYSSAKTR